ncbi:eukaryotic translation initiation factor 1-like [Peromyscus leucopus]|uniref:eukaryotic translation initiation factor 1-like n=1 Tax=Peromyscus leucopus TaxID=10041 RepID=UPI0010A1F6FB|nr:eukaryotic translation initiation factor 1-like [Peromyscus leucopus]
MSAIQIPCSFNPFTGASKGDDLLPVGTEDNTHIQIQQRNDRKILTTVQGIIDHGQAFKKKFAYSSPIIEHPEYREGIWLLCDCQKNICWFLIEIGAANGSAEGS